MNTSIMEDRDVLSALCVDMRDSVDGYQEAAHLVGEHRYRPLFEMRRQSRQTMLNALRERLIQVAPDAKLSDEGSLRGAFHQKFMHLRSLFQGDESAALDEIQSIELALSSQLRDALSRHVTLETYALLTDFITLVEAAQADAEALLAAS